VKTPSIDITHHYSVSATELWSELRHIDWHVNWMADAESITFLSDQREGIDTSFTCRTKIGPIVLTDVMTITAWEDERIMGVRHHGIVTGEGTFTLNPSGSGVDLTWHEALNFPWFFAGTLGAYVARPILRAVWRGNLKRLEKAFK
jgi:hypothetical protein